MASLHRKLWQLNILSTDFFCHLFRPTSSLRLYRLLINCVRVFKLTWSIYSRLHISTLGLTRRCSWAKRTDLAPPTISTLKFPQANLDGVNGAPVGCVSNKYRSKPIEHLIFRTDLLIGGQQTDPCSEFQITSHNWHSSETFWLATVYILMAPNNPLQPCQSGLCCH